jgi:hypothetical protein
MQALLDTEVLPMYEILDSLKNKTQSPASTKGCSVRHLIGQAQLREVHSTALAEVIQINNTKAMSQGKAQYVFLTTGKKVDPTYPSKAVVLNGNPKLTRVQQLNVSLNLQLIEMESIRLEKGTDDDELVDYSEPPF